MKKQFYHLEIATDCCPMKGSGPILIADVNLGSLLQEPLYLLRVP